MRVAGVASSLSLRDSDALCNTKRKLHNWGTLFGKVMHEALHFSWQGPLAN
jgi:hypothetical protein